MSEAVTKYSTIKGALTKYKGEIERAVGKFMTADRMVSIALTSLRKNPELVNTDPASFVGAIIQASQLGLVPDNVTGDAHLVLFKNKRGKTECQLIIGYKGLIKLILRSELVSSYIVRPVYKGDVFEYEFGLNEKLVHIPKGVSSELTHVYSVCKFKSGDSSFDVMTKSEVDIAKSKAKKTNPVWNEFYEAMALKTVARRHAKLLPLSVDVQVATGIDEIADVKPQSNHANLEGELSIDQDYEIMEQEKVDDEKSKRKSKTDEAIDKLL